MLNFIEKEPKNDSNKYLIILLHGWGSNKEDLMFLSEELNKEFDNLHYISVDAPFECDAGFGYQWFSLRDTSPYSVRLTIKDNYKILEDFIEEQSKRLNIPYNHIFLLGFSQGAMMSLFTGIRLNQKLAGIIALSGVLPETVDTMKTDLQIKQKVLMVHGSEDKIVPYEYFLQSEKIFRMFDFNVETTTVYGMTHTINDEVIHKVKNFLYSCLNNNLED